MTTVKGEIRNPRRDSKESFGRNLWYPYYAGYSPHFAEKVISNFDLRPAAFVADPWNGSGTTTWAANYLGFDHWGGDLNPVMKVIAKARLLNPENCRAVATLAEKIIDSARVRYCDANSMDPLEKWFLPKTVAGIRSFERSIRRHVIPKKHREESALNTASISEISSFLYLCLFLLVRQCCVGRVTSNPTWVKSTSQPSIEIDFRSLGEIFTEVTTRLAAEASKEDGISTLHAAKSTIDVASSLQLPLATSSVDLILTSPPYCTRLDYAVATSLELAVLGGKAPYTDTLRRSLMGTTTVPKATNQPKTHWGDSCLAFLNEVKSHPSVASSVYYYKSHLQYFSDLADSIQEISRVIRRDGKVVLVVQDSQYKNVHNDLAKIVCEMAERVQLRLDERRDFDKRLSLRSLHPGRSNYKSAPGPIESVLVFKALPVIRNR